MSDQSTNIKHRALFVPDELLRERRVDPDPLPNSTTVLLLAALVIDRPSVLPPGATPPSRSQRALWIDRHKYLKFK